MQLCQKSLFNSSASFANLAKALSPRCCHLASNGGVKGAISEVDTLLRSGKITHVAYSGAKHYYAHIQHTQLLELLRPHCSEPQLLDLGRQYFERAVIKDGYYVDIKKASQWAVLYLRSWLHSIYLHLIRRWRSNRVSKTSVLWTIG